MAALPRQLGSRKPVRPDDNQVQFHRSRPTIRAPIDNPPTHGTRRVKNRTFTPVHKRNTSILMTNCLVRTRSSTRINRRLRTNRSPRRHARTIITRLLVHHGPTTNRIIMTKQIAVFYNIDPIDRYPLLINRRLPRIMSQQRFLQP